MYAAPPPPQVVVQPPPQIFVPPPPQVVVAPPVVVSAPPAVVSPLATVATVVAPQWQSFPRCAAIATLTLSLLAFLVGFGACFAEYVVLGEQGGSVQVLMFGWQACMRVPFYGYQCVAYASGDDYEQGSGMSLDFDDEYTRNLQLAFTLSILAEIFVLKNTIMTACSMCHARRGSTSCNGAISIGVVSCIATCFYLIALSLVASTSAKLHQDLGGATSLGGGFACQTVCFFLTIGATITGFNFARALRRNARSAGMGVAITSAPPVVAAPVMAHNQYAY